MSGADESSPDTSPTLFDMEMYERLGGGGLLPTPTASDAKTHRRDFLRFQSLQAEMNRQWISSVAASPASPSATPANVKAMQTNAGSGLSLGESFAKLLPNGSWLRTYPGSFPLMGDDYSEAFSQTWPRSGSMRNGIVSELPTSAPRISGDGSSSLPTPRASDAGKGDPARVGRFGTKHGGRNLNDEVLLPTPAAADAERGSLTLKGAALLPTPQSSDWKGPNYSGSGSQSSMGLATKAGGQLNPTWVEWLMGFPLGWTDLEGSVTESFPKSQSISEG